MKLNKLVFSCGVVLVLIFGVLGNNIYVEEVYKMNDLIYVVEYVFVDLLLI